MPSARARREHPAPLFADYGPICIGRRTFPDPSSGYVTERYNSNHPFEIARRSHPARIFGVWVYGCRKELGGGVDLGFVFALQRLIPDPSSRAFPELIPVFQLNAREFPVLYEIY